MKHKYIIPRRAHLDLIMRKISEAGAGVSPDLIEAVAEIIEFADKVSNQMDRHFKRYGLSQPGFLVLMILFNNQSEEWTAIRLAEVIGVKAPTMTGILDTIEKEGFIERIPFPNDRRKSLIRLTEGGKTRFTGILPDHFKRIKASFGGLEERGESLRRKKVFEKITAAINGLHGGEG